MNINSHIENSPGIRANFDRRSGNWNWRYLFVGKRTGPRRSKESVNYYVDRFQWGELKLVSSVLFLCLTDAFFTLIHLQNGAEEINPFLNYFYLNHGFWALCLVKFLITGPALIFLLLHIRFIRAKTGLLFLLSVYGILNIYHLLGFYL